MNLNLCIRLSTYIIVRKFLSSNVPGLIILFFLIDRCSRSWINKLFFRPISARVDSSISFRNNHVSSICRFVMFIVAYSEVSKLLDSFYIILSLNTLSLSPVVFSYVFGCIICFICARVSQCKLILDVESFE